MSSTTWFVIASLCHRLRRVYLVIGLLAALTLVGVELSRPRAGRRLSRASRAQASLWSVVALAFLAQRLSLRAAPLALENSCVALTYPPIRRNG